ncbi:hypothetical protein TNCV_3616151 [Trichonephila clavipes]|nr:hypothetical protein TNCV_3616151 [Trichonephila clavipes]
MEIPLRTAYGQAGRCDMQPKPSSLRAQAHQTVEPQVLSCGWWEAPDHALGFLPPLNVDGTEPNCTVTGMVLKAKANDRRKNSSPEPR